MVIQSILEKLGNLIGVGSKLPRRVKTFIEKNADVPLTSLKVCRTPVNNTIVKILNAVSLGLLNKVQQRMGYDKMFHLTLVLNNKYVMEKNQVLNIGSSYSSSKDEECEDVDLGGQDVTIGEFVSKTEKRMGNRFYKYDAFNQNGGGNCQDFVKNALAANGLDTHSSFVDQKAEEIAKSLPGYVKEGSRTITDLAALGDFLRQAVGLKKGGVVTMPLTEFEKEHLHLIKLLESTDEPAFQAEAARQKKELALYQ
jgi:hypothetical protein